MPDTQVVLKARQITKRFPSVLANDHVSITLQRGEIMALLGENGAGKSTLMNILYGLYHPDEGQVWVKGEKMHFAGPSDAIAAGIGMVHQHFQLVAVMSVAENVILGSEVVGRGGFLDQRGAARAVRDLSQQYGLEVDPDAIIEELPVGSQQRVEIIKALYRHADILILDEPTSVLTPQEVEQLFNILRGLTERGVSIIFITHKLKEVLAIADNIAVMRGGMMVGEVQPQAATEQSLASLMVGREVLLRVPKGPAAPAEVILTVQGLTATDDRGHEVVNGTSFEIRGGEILGIAGVQGNGQTELVEVLSGLREPSGGVVSIDGEAIRFGDPRFVTETGTAHIPEDRQRYGLVLPYSVADNLVLNTYYREPYTRRRMLDPRAIERKAMNLVDEFDIRTPSLETLASSLSGGNQQKVVVAREVGRPIKLLIASQPTRGLDVGSIEYIHRRIIAQRDSGVAVLLVSAELDEIMSLSDRIAVMFNGQILATLPAADATREQIGLLMAGIIQ